MRNHTAGLYALPVKRLVRIPVVDQGSRAIWILDDLHLNDQDLLSFGSIFASLKRYHSLPNLQRVSMGLSGAFFGVCLELPNIRNTLLRVYTPVSTNRQVPFTFLCVDPQILET